MNEIEFIYPERQLIVMLSFTFSVGQHVVERVVANTLFQPLHPLVLLFLVAGRHPVHGVFAFDHFPLRVCLARFDEVRTATRVQLETVLFLTVRALSH